MHIRRRSGRRTVRVIRNVVKCSSPKRLKLSPITAAEVLREADPEELDIVWVREKKEKDMVRHISFRGVPIYLSIKLSHRMQLMALL